MLTLFRPIEFSIRLHPKKSGWSTGYIEGHELCISKAYIISCFEDRRCLSKQWTVYQNTYFGVSSIQRVMLLFVLIHISTWSERTDPEGDSGSGPLEMLARTPPPKAIVLANSTLFIKILFYSTKGLNCCLSCYIYLHKVNSIIRIQRGTLGLDPLEMLVRNPQNKLVPSGPIASRERSVWPSVKYVVD